MFIKMLACWLSGHRSSKEMQWSMLQTDITGHKSKMKGPEWNSLLFAHLLTLNNRKNIGCAGSTFGVCDGGTPYVAISKCYHCDITVISQTQNLLIWLHMEFLHQRHLRWGPHNLWAFCYLRLTDGQIAMDSIQGLWDDDKC